MGIAEDNGYWFEILDGYAEHVVVSPIKDGGVKRLKLIDDNDLTAPGIWHCYDWQNQGVVYSRYSDEACPQ